MYWNSNPATSIHLLELLSKKDVTLQEIMDDEGVLQECKSQNKRLIDYLVRSDVLEKLVSLTTEEPTEDEDDVTKYKYSNIACELLTCEVPQLGESLARDEALLRKLYSFLEADAPLNPLLASFFSKTLGVLITRNNEQNWYSYQFTCLKVLGFLKSKEDSIALLLKHLGTSAIMDLVFKLVTKVEGSDVKENILNWLDEQKLVENLVSLLDPRVHSDVHHNVAQLLCDVIRTSRANKIQAFQPNKILDRIESPETTSLLLDFILKEPKCETSIVGGISVLLTLLEDKCSNGNGYAYEEPPQYNADYLKVAASTTKAILPRLKDFHDILLHPPVKPPVKTTIAVLEPPLGYARVEVAKLLSVLVASNNEEINEELASLNTIDVLLDLFFEYSWNNFLHTQVQKCLAFALNSENIVTKNGRVAKSGLIAHILTKCRLIQRILDAWRDNETQQTENNRPRRGYMGHLITIAHDIVRQTETHSFGALIKETVDVETLNKWESFVTTELAEIFLQREFAQMESYSTHSGGEHASSDDKDDGDAKGDTYGNFSQLYSKYYQSQTLAPPFTGQFGSSQEDQYNDDEDIASASANSNFEKRSFVVNEEDADRRAVFFEKVCALKFQTLDFKIWNQDSTPAEKLTDDGERDFQTFESSSSDEEEIESLKKSLNFQKGDNFTVSSDHDVLSPWPDEADVPPVESSNPWESSQADTVASPDLGWANFESAPFIADFGLGLTPDINTTIATSSSFEIDAIPLDLTPSEGNSYVDDMFSKEFSNDEKMQVAEESDPTSTAFVTDFSVGSKETGAEVLKEPSGNSLPAVVADNKKLKTESDLSNSQKENQIDKESIPADSVKNPEVIGDAKNLPNSSEPKQDSDDSRFSLPRCLVTNSERESESGDSCRLPEENVQTVPRESSPNSKEMKTSSSDEKSPDCPI